MQFALVSTLAVALGLPTTTMSEAPVDAQRGDTSRAEAHEDLLARYLASDVVFVGEVLSVGPCPASYEGFVSARQRVEFDVQGVLKGPQRLGRVAVQFAVIRASDLVDKKEPCLDAALFAPGLKLVVFVRRRADISSATPELPDKGHEGGPAFATRSTPEVVGELEGWSRRNSCSSETGVWMINVTEGSIRFEGPAGAVLMLGGEQLTPLVGAGFRLANAERSPDTLWVAVELRVSSSSREVANAMLLVLGPQGPGDSRELDARWVELDCMGGDVTAFGGHSPLWIDLTHVAFLAEGVLKTSPHVFVADVASGDVQAIPILGAPLALVRVAGQVFARTQAGLQRIAFDRCCGDPARCAAMTDTDK